MVLSFRQNAVAVCNQLNILILYYTSSRQVTLLEVFDVSIQVSGILVLNVIFKIINLLKPNDCLMQYQV